MISRYFANTRRERGIPASQGGPLPEAGGFSLALESPPSLANDLLARLPGSPDAYPQKLDLVARRVLVIQCDANLYRKASFLDDRILGPETKGAWLALGVVADASRRVGNARPLHFIFHTGHVGSTLVSRILDETGIVHSLREPLPLRTLADAHDALGRSDSLWSEAELRLALGAFLRLWGRGYANEGCVTVKATSSAGRLAVRILAESGSSRAIYMNLRAEPYLATLLAGQNSPIDLRGHGPERIRRLESWLAAPLAPLHSLSIGELAAMSWLAETWTQRNALTQCAGRIIPVDFDMFLANVADVMRTIIEHFGLPVDSRFLAGVGRSEALTRYSKAPEYAYGPSVRADILRDSRRANRDEIRKGMAWLEQRAKSSGAAGEVVAGGS